MIEKWVIEEPLSGAIKRCIVCLPGRHQTADFIMNVGRAMKLPDTLLVGLQPEDCQWYPQPYSAEVQREAVGGLPRARDAVMRATSRIVRGWPVKGKDIALIGFSAGAVMTLEVATKTPKPYAAAISFAGAIFEPKNVPPRTDKNGCPILLVHNEGDECFGWDERYIPMRDALCDKGYDVTTSEGDWRGGHTIYISDMIEASNFLAKQFGIEDWVHPRLLWNEPEVDEEEGGEGEEDEEDSEEEEEE